MKVGQLFLRPMLCIKKSPDYYSQTVPWFKGQIAIKIKLDADFRIKARFRRNYWRIHNRQLRVLMLPDISNFLSDFIINFNIEKYQTNTHKYIKHEGGRKCWSVLVETRNLWDQSFPAMKGNESTYTLFLVACQLRINNY